MKGVNYSFTKSNVSESYSKDATCINSRRGIPWLLMYCSVTLALRLIHTQTHFASHLLATAVQTLVKAQAS